MEVLKYHNDVNKISMGMLKEKEIDLFFALMFKCRDEGTTKQVLSFEELRKLTGQKKTDRMLNHLWILFKKMIDLKFVNYGEDEKKGKYKEMIVVFTHFRIFEETHELHLSISEEFENKLNGLLSNFTIFELKELVSLKGAYTKTLFRLLKQWQTTKKYTVRMDEFKELMGIPSSYETRDIDKQILKPALEQLKEFFPSLKLQKVKKGVKIDSLVFTWTEKEKLIEKNIVEEENILPVGIDFVPPEEREPTEEEIEMVKFLNKKFNLGYSEKFLTPQIARAVLKEKGLW